MVRTLTKILPLWMGISLIQAQDSQVWVADRGDGTYGNPILHADYSDPDVIRVGEDYFMTASSFTAVPGLPILNSRDLVNWRFDKHAIMAIPHNDEFERTYQV